MCYEVRSPTEAKACMSVTEALTTARGMEGERTLWRCGECIGRCVGLGQQTEFSLSKSYHEAMVVCSDCSADLRDECVALTPGRLAEVSKATAELRGHWAPTGKSCGVARCEACNAVKECELWSAIKEENHE